MDHRWEVRVHCMHGVARKLTTLMQHRAGVHLGLEGGEAFPRGSLVDVLEADALDGGDVGDGVLVGERETAANEKLLGLVVLAVEDLHDTGFQLRDNGGVPSGNTILTSDTGDDDEVHGGLAVDRGVRQGKIERHLGRLLCVVESVCRRLERAHLRAAGCESGGPGCDGADHCSFGGC